MHNNDGLACAHYLIIQLHIFSEYVCRIISQQSQPADEETINSEAGKQKPENSGFFTKCLTTYFCQIKCICFPFLQACPLRLLRIAGGAFAGSKYVGI
jgi:hypothetical protein